MGHLWLLLTRERAYIKYIAGSDGAGRGEPRTVPLGMHLKLVKRKRPQR